MARDFGRVGIIECGGAFRGIAAVTGFQAALFEYGITPSYMQAVSVSACSEPLWEHPDLLVRMLGVIEEKGPSFIFPRLSLETFKSRFGLEPYLWEGRGIRRLIEYIDSQIGFNTLCSSPIRREVVVFNRRTRKREFISNHDKLVKRDPDILKRGHLAALSIYGIFPDVRIYEDSDDTYCDAHLFSIARALEFCDTVFLLRGSVTRNVEVGGFFHKLLGMPIINIMDNKDIVEDECAKEEMERYKDHLVVFDTGEEINTLTPFSYESVDISRMILLAFEIGNKILKNL